MLSLLKPPKVMLFVPQNDLLLFRMELPRFCGQCWIFYEMHLRHQFFIVDG